MLDFARREWTGEPQGDATSSPAWTETALAMIGSKGHSGPFLKRVPLGEMAVENKLRLPSDTEKTHSLGPALPPGGCAPWRSSCACVSVHSRVRSPEEHVWQCRLQWLQFTAVDCRRASWHSHTGATV